MKRMLIITALTLSMNPLLAQVKVGVKAGGMLTNLAHKGIGLGPSASDAKFSYLAGVTLVLPIHDRLRVQTELLYSNKGMHTSVEGFNGPSNISHNSHYLSVPVLLRYRITNQLSIGAGPEVGYLLGAYQQSTEFKSHSVRSFYKPLDLSLNLDIQYDVADRLSLGLRYNLGVYDITKRYEFLTFGDTPFVIDNDVYNRALQLSLVYWFCSYE